MNCYETTDEAYLGTLRDVFYNYEYNSAPRGLAIRERVDYGFRVENPSSESLVTADPERNLRLASYLASENALYASGANLADDFVAASKFWKKLANPDGTINSAYGFLIWFNKSHGNPKFSAQMMTPWEWARESLLKDRDSRQAVMRFSLPEHAYPGVKDFTCTMHGDWLIRDDRLNLSMVMRSNDVVLGLAYDLPWFCGLMDKMLAELKPTYPNLTKGTYTHYVHSIHAYERDAATIKKMLGER